MTSIRGDRVRFLRKARGWTQPQALERVREIVGPGRFSRNTLSEIENDSYLSEPGGWLLEALAQTLDTSIDFLVGLSDDPGISGVTGYPVPELDIAELVDRLNRLPEELRREVAGLIGGAVDLAERLARGLRPQLVMREGRAAYDVDAQAAQREQMLRLWEMVDDDQRSRMLADLEEAYARRLSANS